MSENLNTRRSFDVSDNTDVITAKNSPTKCFRFVVVVYKVVPDGHVKSPRQENESNIYMWISLKEC